MCGGVERTLVCFGEDRAVATKTNLCESLVVVVAVIDIVVHSTSTAPARCRHEVLRVDSVGNPRVRIVRI